MQQKSLTTGEALATAKQLTAAAGVARRQRRRSFRRFQVQLPPGLWSEPRSSAGSRRFYPRPANPLPAGRHSSTGARPGLRGRAVLRRSRPQPQLIRRVNEHLNSCRHHRKSRELPAAPRASVYRGSSALLSIHRGWHRAPERVQFRGRNIANEMIGSVAKLLSSIPSKLSLPKVNIISAEVSTCRKKADQTSTVARKLATVPPASGRSRQRTRIPKAPGISFGTSHREFTSTQVRISPEDRRAEVPALNRPLILIVLGARAPS